MKTIAERLKSARKMHGLSLQELADALGNRISRQALHKYEKGLSVPDSSLINAICYALHIKPDFFYRDNLVELGTISYRKLSNLSASDQSMAIERSRDLLERYLELETLMGVDSAFQNPLSNPDVLDAQDVEKAANEVRQKWQLGIDALPNVLELLENKEIKVLEIEAHNDFNGMSSLVSGKIPIIVVNKAQSIDRLRFTALHELGHLILKFPEGIEERTEERLCHVFAGAMLLPAESLRYELGNNRHDIHMKELEQIKEKYGISMQAIVMRAKMHGIVSEYFTEQFFKKFRAMGYSKNEPGHYQGVEKATRFNQLLLRGLAEEVFSQSKAATLANLPLYAFRDFLKVKTNDPIETPI
jgi:Zn-dependent peptidase ImmA (M78 family)/DNA-binding XRE family transcriptional regulator